LNVKFFYQIDKKLATKVLNAVNLHIYSYFSTILNSALKNLSETNANESKNQLSTTAKAVRTILAGLDLLLIKTKKRNKNKPTYFLFKYLSLVKTNSNNDKVLPTKPMKIIENT
jgi:hypothetical protein